MMRCGICNAKSEVGNMRYHKSGEYLICASCYEKQSPLKSTVKSGSSFKEPEMKQPRQDKVAYRCRNCGYSFTRASDHAVLLCPYCGKDSVSVVEGGNIAQHIIDKAV